MSDELEQEDLSALGVLEDLAHGAGQEDTAPVEPPPADEAAEVLRRLYVEGLGLLAYDLLPAQPQPGTRATVLAHLIGDETQEVSPLMIGAAHGAFAPAPAISRPPVGPALPAELTASVTPLRPVEEKRLAEPAAAAAAYGEAQARQKTRRSRWPAALATLFALAAAGLGVWVAMLQSEIAYRDTQINGLKTRLAEVDQAKAELEASRAELATLELRHAFVTAPSTKVFSLRPPAGSLQQTVRGSLFVAPDQRHWQLEVRGLKPEPELQDYQIWFIVDGLPISGGVFDAKAGKVALLADDALPAGTTAIAITLERKGGTASPTSPGLLTAASFVQL
ncbi:MAG: anti-sigma factor [Thermoanaerobaculia bacterium]